MGTLINVVSILMGGTLGILLGAKLPERVRQTVVTGLGLFCLVLGIQMFLKTGNSLVVLGSLLAGVLLGEWWQVESGLQNLGRWLEEKLVRGGDQDGQARFIRGFLTASLVFCVGPVAILGSIQDGLAGDYRLLTVKSILDGFASLAFASSLGVGVLFSALPILIYQGGITLLAFQFQSVVSDQMMNEMTAVGGVILLAISIGNLLEIKPIRTGNFLPALFLAPLVVFLLNQLGIGSFF